MHRHLRLTFVWIVVAATACDRSASNESIASTDSLVPSVVAEATPVVIERPALACFAAESLALAPLVFGNIRAVEGGYDGFEVRFIQTDSAFSAAERSAWGGVPAPTPLESLSYFPERDSLVLWTPVAGNIQYSFSFAPRCDTLRGFARYSSDRVEPLVLPRVTKPLPQMRVEPHND